MASAISSSPQVDLIDVTRPNSQSTSADIINGENQPYIVLRNVVRDEWRRLTVLAAEADLADTESCFNPSDDNFQKKKKGLIEWLHYWKG